MFFIVILSRVEILFHIDFLCTLTEFIFGNIYVHFMLRDGNCTNTYNNFVEAQIFFTLTVYSCSDTRSLLIRNE